MEGEVIIKFLRFFILTCVSALTLSGCALLFKPEYQEFRPISIQEPRVRVVADFAVQAQEKAMREQGEASRLTLVKIMAAGQQITVNTKYRLRLSVKIDGYVRHINTSQEKTFGIAEAIVWQKVSGELVLVAWIWT